MRFLALILRCGSRTLRAASGLFFCTVLTGLLTAADTRPPAVAGQFYPSDPEKLKLAVDQFLKGTAVSSSGKPIALVVPHAGYVYSGQIGGDAYRQAMGFNYETVVILGVNHTTGGFRGISLGNYSAFSTPLGSIPVDEEITSALLSECKDCVANRQVHIAEHSIEVQLPFIQVLFPKARIVPAIIHPPDYNMCIRFGKVLGKVLKNRQALIVISSDLSHYPSGGNAAKVDRQTLDAITSLDTTRFASLMTELEFPNVVTRACGEAAIIAGITAAKSLGAKRAFVVRYANSGDMPAGDQSRTVGYGAVVLVSEEAPGRAADRAVVHSPLNPAPLQLTDKKILLALARESIRHHLAPQTPPPATSFPARLNIQQGAFVTLRKKGELRGCIGRMAADTELAKTVGMMALQAALNDPRFPPVELSELKNLEIEVSVLTPMRSITTVNEIMVGRDGVLISKSGRSAVFLPQVATENNWGRSEMLDNLCRKAGLPYGCWKHDATFQVFQAEVFSESQLK
jgi:AmmeMemoRadiSam system protein B/AmmeMemoRadiSam system protein A